MQLAHEKWFTDADYTPDWSFALQPRTLAFVAAAFVIAGLWRWIDRFLPRPEIGPLAVLGRLAPWIPRLLAVHAGVSLLAQSATGTYLAPHLDLPAGVPGIAFAVVEGLVGVWLISGFRVKAAAWLLVIAGPAGMIFYGPVEIVERADLLGIALFLAVLPPGSDAHGAVVPSTRELARALWLLRVAAGTSLVVIGLTEKLLAPQTSLEFLDRYPAFNVFEVLGLPIGELDFVRFAGATEVLIGFLILSGAAPQAAVIVAGIPFNATLFFLGTEELIGHLPIYGAMLTLLVYGSHAKYAPQVRRLWPWR